MRSINRMLAIMLILSLVTFILYVIEGQYLFSLVILSFMSVLISGFQEFGSNEYTFKIAHLYVGSILFLIAAGYVFFTFTFSIVNVFIGEEIYKLSPGDVMLLITGAYSIIYVIHLRKAALKPDKTDLMSTDANKTCCH
uniref:Uncharacterized protein n=1 Tax=Fervidobacterium pennivorans TaxID=93466 RepID=A0A7C4RYY5_FERPE